MLTQDIFQIGITALAWYPRTFPHFANVLKTLPCTVGTTEIPWARNVLVLQALTRQASSPQDNGRTPLDLVLVAYSPDLFFFLRTMQFVMIALQPLFCCTRLDTHGHDKFVAETRFAPL